MRSFAHLFFNTQWTATPLPPGAKPMYILQVQFVVKAKHQKAANPANDVPESKFVTLIIDPRHNYY